VVLAVLPASAWALDPQRAITQYVHHEWNSADGLPQNSVVGIVQSDDGYLWLGTWDGLCRFDGTHFTVFNRQNTPAFRSNTIVVLRKTPDGAIWAGTDEGLVRYKDGVFTGYTTNDGLSTNYITGVAGGGTGDLWVFTSRGLFRATSTTPIRFEAVPQAPRMSLTYAIVDRRSRLWFTAGATLYRMSGSTLDQIPPPVDTRLSRITRIYEDARGGILVATSNGIYRYANDEWTTLAAAPSGATTMLVDRHGKLWAGFDEGLARLGGDHRWEWFNEHDGLNANYVGSLFEDQEGTIWAGTSSGLSSFSSGKFTALGKAEGLSADYANSIVEDRRHNVWAATAHGVTEITATSTVLE